MLALLLGAGVAIIGLYYHFKHKNAIREKEKFFDLELAAIDPAGNEGVDANALMDSPSCDSDLINPNIIGAEVAWGQVEKIQSYGSPPGSVVRSSKTVGEGVSTQTGSDPFGVTPGYIADDLTDDGGLYEPAEGARRATGVNLSRTEPFVMDGNLTHPGFQSQSERFDEEPRRLPEIVQDGNLTHLGFLKQKDDLDDIDEGPRLTHPGFLEQKDDLDDISYPEFLEQVWEEEDDLDDVDVYTE